MPSTRMDRRTLGIELKESYYKCALDNCAMAMEEPILGDEDAVL